MFKLEDPKNLLNDVHPLAQGIFHRMAKEAHDQGLIPYLTQDANGQIHLRSRTPQDRVIKLASKKTAALDNIIKYAKQLSAKGREHIKKEKKKVRSKVYSKYPSLKKESGFKDALTALKNLASSGIQKTKRGAELLTGTKKRDLRRTFDELVEQDQNLRLKDKLLREFEGTVFSSADDYQRAEKKLVEELKKLGPVFKSEGLDIPLERQELGNLLRESGRRLDSARKTYQRESSKSMDAQLLGGAGALGVGGAAGLAALLASDEEGQEIKPEQPVEIPGHGTWTDLTKKESAIIEDLLKKMADINLDIDKGDTLLGGKFKNKAMKVEEFGTDDLGQPTVNGKNLLAHRINKTLPPEKQKKEAVSNSLLAKLIGPKLQDIYKIGKPMHTMDAEATKFFKKLMETHPNIGKRLTDSLSRFKSHGELPVPTLLMTEKLLPHAQSKRVDDVIKFMNTPKLSKLKVEESMLDLWKEAKLTPEARAKLSDADFAIPERRKYPIHDKRHASLALHYVSKHGSDEEKSRVRTAVSQKYPGLEAYKKADALWSWINHKDAGGVLNILNNEQDPEKKQEEMETYLPKIRKTEKERKESPLPERQHKNQLK